VARARLREIVATRHGSGLGSDAPETIRGKRKRLVVKGFGQYTRRESNPVAIPLDSQGVPSASSGPVRDPVQFPTEDGLRTLVANLTPEHRAFLLHLLTSCGPS